MRRFVIPALAPIAALIAADPAPRVLTYPDALEVAFDRSPDIKLALLDLKKTQWERSALDQPLPANPEAELIAVDGQKRSVPVPSYSTAGALRGDDPFDVSPNSYAGGNKQKVSGFEFGLSQQVDLSGRRCIELKVAESSVEQASNALVRARLSVRGAVRTNLVTWAVMAKLENDLRLRIARLREVRGRKGAAFIDPRLGAYAGHAFTADMSDLEADRQQTQMTRNTARSMLQNLLVIRSDEVISAPNPESILLPVLPSDDVLVAQAAKYNPDMKALGTEMRRKKSAAELTERLNYPTPTLFGSYGQTRFGAGGPFGPGKEMEKTARFGIRFTIPVNNVDGQQKSAQSDLERTQMEMDRLSATLDGSVRSAAARYRDLLKLRTQIREGLAASSYALDEIDRAFVMGRISYLDYWSEYDRSNRFLKRYAETLSAAAEACGAVEMLIGQSLDTDE